MRAIVDFLRSKSNVLAYIGILHIEHAIGRHIWSSLCDLIISVTRLPLSLATIIRAAFKNIQHIRVLRIRKPTPIHRFSSHLLLLFPYNEMNN